MRDRPGLRQKGQKLSRFHPDFEIIGIDIGPNVRYCKKHFGVWPVDSALISKPGIHCLSTFTILSTPLLCAPTLTIEHLLDPAGVLINLRRCLEHAPLAFLSTPERDLVRGKEHAGPPPNPHHIREWNASELGRLLRHFDLNVAFLGLTAADNIHGNLDTIMAVLSRRPALVFAPDPGD